MHVLSCPNMSCPHPVPFGEHHGDRTCTGHVPMSILFADFWTWDVRTFRTKPRCRPPMPSIIKRTCYRCSRLVIVMFNYNVNVNVNMKSLASLENTFHLCQIPEQEFRIMAHKDKLLQWVHVHNLIAWCKSESSSTYSENSTTTIFQLSFFCFCQSWRRICSLKNY